MTSAAAQQRQGKLPTYWVSASHRAPGRRRNGSSWVPYGTQHAREVGSPVTACGDSAFDWPFFWELPFPTGAIDTCAACMAEVVRKPDGAAMSA